MSDNPTSVQYALGVKIGRLIVEAMKDGASYDEVIETLHHSKRLAERNKEFGIDLTKLPDTPTKPGSGCPEGYGLVISLNPDRESLIEVLAGDEEHLKWAFDWSKEQHGTAYWQHRKFGEESLSDTDRQFLEYLLAESSS